MNLMEQFLKSCNYRITEGSEYQWECYGPWAYCLDSWDGNQDGHSFTVIFDTRNQTVYELQAHDYQRTRAYRWVNPEFRSDREEECVDRGSSLDEAWDDLKYVDLETTEDFFTKMSAIYSNESYDTRVQVPLELGDDEMFQLMKMAHEQDITLNQLVEQLLRRVIEEEELRRELDEITIS